VKIKIDITMFLLPNSLQHILCTGCITFPVFQKPEKMSDILSRQATVLGTSITQNP